MIIDLNKTSNFRKSNYSNVGSDSYVVEITIHTINGPITSKHELSELDFRKDDGKLFLSGRIK